MDSQAGQGAGQAGGEPERRRWGWQGKVYFDESNHEQKIREAYLDCLNMLARHVYEGGPLLRLVEFSLLKQDGTVKQTAGEAGAQGGMEQAKPDPDDSGEDSFSVTMRMAGFEAPEEYLRLVRLRAERRGQPPPP